MSDDCEIENRLDDRCRALRHLTRAISELELAGCDDIRSRLEAAHGDLLEMTPGGLKPRRKLKSGRLAASTSRLSEAHALGERLRRAFQGY